MDTNENESLIGKVCLWRYTAETPKFAGVLDSRALLPFLLVLFHTRFWVLYLSLFSTLCFVILGMFRINPIQGLRAAGLWIVTLGFRRAHLAHRVPRRSMSFLND